MMCQESRESELKGGEVEVPLVVNSNSKDLKFVKLEAPPVFTYIQNSVFLVFFTPKSQSGDTPRDSSIRFGIVLHISAPLVM